MRAYDETYLDDAQQSMGEMMDYAVYDLQMDPDEFFNLFAVSRIAECFGSGSPKYIAGMTGIELAEHVLGGVSAARMNRAKQPLAKTSWYWAGWIMAYYQWWSCMSFAQMARCGLTPSAVEKVYVFHEADPSKFADWADEFVRAANQDAPTHLKTIRKARKMTQAELAEASGTSLRMVQLYEQRRSSIDSASAATVARMAHVLGCNIEDLLEDPFNECYEYAMVKL